MIGSPLWRRATPVPPIIEIVGLGLAFGGFGVLAKSIGKSAAGHARRTFPYLWRFVYTRLGAMGDCGGHGLACGKCLQNKDNPQREASPCNRARSAAKGIKFHS